MYKKGQIPENRRLAYQAITLWIVFFVLMVLINGTIPFALGHDLRSWSDHEGKFALVGFIAYGVIFLFVPIVLVKGWKTVLSDDFLIPLVTALASLSLWHYFTGIAVIALVIIAYLHRRFDLSALSIRSRGLRDDALSVGLLVCLSLVPSFFTVGAKPTSPGQAIYAGVDRLLFNPASSVENLFYFGFLAERLSRTLNRWLTSIIIGLMYTCHEMTNPEYWLQYSSFSLIFIGVVVSCFVFLWRRNVVVIWLASGLSRFATRIL